MADQEHAPVIRVQDTALIAILIGDQVIKGPLQVDRPVEVNHPILGHFDFLPAPGAEIDALRRQQLAASRIVPDATLHGRRNHVESQELVEPVGGDLEPPAIELPPDAADRALPQSLATYALVFKIEDTGRRNGSVLHGELTG